MTSFSLLQLQNAGMAHMGVGRAGGKNKAEDAAKMAISSPLLEAIFLKDGRVFAHRSVPALC